MRDNAGIAIQPKCQLGQVIRTDGHAVEDIEELIGQLTLTTFLPVETITEAFSSMEAHGKRGKEQMAARATRAPQKPDDLDARAAAVILQRFLDTKSKKKK